MLEVKLRLQHAERVAASQLPVTGIEALDSEFCFLQIRRVVELITFSAAIREEERYKRLRVLQKEENPRDHGDYSKDWEAPEILKRLSQISLHFLPIPIKKIQRAGDHTFHIDRKGLPASHGRLIDIYKTAGGYLHGKNPLGKDFVELVAAERKKYKRARLQIQKTLIFLRELMWNHAAIGLEWTEESDPRELANPRKAWLVDFGSEEASYVQIHLAEGNP
jgi:hypothetical protein